jgi:Flp pilus assembly protein TadB
MSLYVILIIFVVVLGGFVAVRYLIKHRFSRRKVRFNEDLNEIRVYVDDKWSTFSSNES